jgi:hypothetical protein
MQRNQQDEVYLHSSINLDESYAVGNEWVAFKATLSDSGKNVIVKRYTSHDQSRRKVCILTTRLISPFMVLSVDARL